jgi:5'-3' exonuclease
MKNLIFDTHHLLHRTFFSITEKLNADDLSALGLHKALFSMNKMFKKFNPDRVICVFDSSSWRKDYTNSDGCITYKKYKGNRRQNLDEDQIIKYKIFDAHIQQFREMLKTKTGISVYHREKLEADDIIWGIVDSNPDDDHIIITGDNDFLQLLRYSNVTIYDPIQEKNKDLLEYDSDAEYFMFHKCFRGDTGDNVMSAYPRLRSEKIKKAYTDDFTLENLLQHTFEQEFFDDSGKLVKQKFKTLDVFFENMTLMDLTCQPYHIKEMIRETVSEDNRSRYNMIQFGKYCKSVGLQNISENISNFTDLLVGGKR